MLGAQLCASHEARNRLARPEGPAQMLPLSREIEGQSSLSNSPNILSLHLENQRLLHYYISTSSSLSILFVYYLKWSTSPKTAQGPLS